MTTPSPVAVRLTGDRTAVAVRPLDFGELPRAVAALGLAVPAPVVVVVGGAGRLDAGRMDSLRSLFDDAIGPAIRARGAIGVDGGTDHGVMRLMGRTRLAGAPFPLVGVAAIDTVHYPGHRGANPDAAPLEPHHSHFVLVPGREWGDEVPWMSGVASALSDGRPSVTLLVNGGEISLEDVRCSVAAGRPVLVLAGTGRSADRIAAAAADPAGCDDSRVAFLARSPLVRVFDVTNRAAAVAALHDALDS